LKQVADDTESKHIPVNEVNFKLSIDVKHEGGHYLKLKFNWFQLGAAPAEPTLPTPIEA